MRGDKQNSGTRYCPKGDVQWAFESLGMHCFETDGIEYQSPFLEMDTRNRGLLPKIDTLTTKKLFLIKRDPVTHDFVLQKINDCRKELNPTPCLRNLFSEFPNFGYSLDYSRMDSQLDFILSPETQAKFWARFMPSGSSAVADRMLGIAWKKKWDCCGSLSLDEVQREISAVNSGNAPDAQSWRLPTAEELQSLSGFMNNELSTMFLEIGRDDGYWSGSRSPGQDTYWVYFPRSRKMMEVNRRYLHRAVLVRPL